MDAFYEGGGVRLVIVPVTFRRRAISSRRITGIIGRRGA